MRVLRALLVGVFALAALVAAVAGSFYAWLQTDSGRDLVIALLEEEAREPDLELSIRGLGGSIPFAPTVAELVFRDPTGPWLTITNARTSLDPWALLQGRLDGAFLVADRVAVEREPVETVPRRPGPPKLPKLPLPVTARHLEVGEVYLGAGLLDGATATLHAVGSAQLGRKGEALSAKLALERVDGTPGRGRLDFDYTPQGDGQLDLALELAEPAGGVMARLAELPGLPPVEVALKGAGSLAAWHGRLNARAGEAGAGEVGRLAADAEIRATEAGHQLSIAADAELAVIPRGAAVPLFGPDWAPLVGPRPVLSAEVVFGKNGRIGLEPAAFQLAAGTVSLSGGYDLAQDRLALDVEIVTEPGSPLHDTVPELRWGPARLRGTVQGPPRSPAFEAELEAEGLAVAGFASPHGVLRARAVPTGPIAVRGTGFEVAADLTLDGLTSTPDPVTAALTRDPQVRIEAGGQVLPALKEIRIGALAVTTRAAALTGEAVLRDWGDAFDAIAHLKLDDLGPLSELAGLKLAGAAKLDGTVQIDGDGEPVKVAVTGSGRDLRTGIAELDPLLAGTVKLAGNVAVGPKGAVRAPDIKVNGRHGELTGRFALHQGRVDAAARLSLPNLSVLAAPLGVPARGPATVEATAQGAPSALEIKAQADSRELWVADRRLGRTQVELAASQVPTAPRGTVRLRSELAGHGLTAEAGLARRDPGTLQLSDLVVASGGNRITGALQVSLDHGGLTGKLTGDLKELAGLSELAGRPLGGLAGLELALDGHGGRQAATLAASLRNLSVAGADGALLTAGELELGASLADLSGRPTGKVKLDGRRVQAGGTDLGTLAASAEGSLAQAGFHLAASGDTARSGDIDLSGTLSLEGAHTRVRLDQGRATIAGDPYRLAGPATIEAGPQRLLVSGLDLRGPKARLALDGGIDRNALKGGAVLEQVPLELFGVFDPSLKLRGRLDAEARFGGTLGDPRADLTAKVAGLKAALAEQAGFAGIDAQAEAQWRGGRLAVTGTAAAEQGGIDLRGRADLPLTLRAEPFALGLVDTAPAQAHVGGRIDLSRFNDLLAATGDRLAGRMEVDVAMSGTLKDPRLGGQVEVSDGRYENQAIGTVITDITARLSGSGQSLAIERFAGKTPDGGPVQATGAIRFAADALDQLDLRVNAQDARLLQIDLVTANADADLELTGSFREARLKGQFKVRRGDIHVPDRMPPSVVELDVVEVGTGGDGVRREARRLRAPVPGHKPQPAGAPQGQPGTPEPRNGGGPVVGLALEVEAQNQVFVRGRGLDAEFGGRLTVTGTDDEPSVLGTLTMVRGRLDFLGKQFTFRRGEIRFPGGPRLEPELDLEAEASATGITALVKVTGTVSQPKLELSSTPNLPKDEVLARVLFDKPMSQLSTVEAVQLAQSAAQLVGFGAGQGIVDKVRQTFGLDRLEIVGGGSGKGVAGGGASLRTPVTTARAPGTEDGRGGKGGPAVSAGRYVSDQVYVGVEQGVTNPTSRATVEIDLTNNIQAQAKVGTNADTQFGLKFEWDY